MAWDVLVYTPPPHRGLLSRLRPIHRCVSRQAGLSAKQTVGDLLDKCVAPDVDVGIGTDNMTVVLMELIHKVN